MHADSADQSAMAFANFNFRAIFSFRKIRENYTPAKKGLYKSELVSTTFRPDLYSIVIISPLSTVVYIDPHQ